MKKFILLIAVSLITSSISAQNWSTFAGSNRKNGLTKHNGPVSVATNYWTINASTSVWGNAIYTWNNMFATARTTFSPYVGKIELRSLTDGSLIWDKTISPTAIMYLVGFTEDAVYACDYGASPSVLYALRLSDGSVKWQVNSVMFPGNTGICFAPNGDPIVFGQRLDWRNGSPKWTNNYIIPVGPDGGYVVNGNTYYHWTGSIVTPKNLIAIDINSGITKYQSFDLPGDGDQENDLVIGPDGTIYIARDGGALYAFTDNGSGFTQKWTLSPAVLVKSFGPNNVIYCANINSGTTNGPLMRVNGLTGQVIDYVSPSTLAGYVTVAADSTVYVATAEAGTGRYIAYTYDLQTIKWQLNIPYNYYNGCPLGKEGVFVVSGSGTNITAYKRTISRKPVADFYTPVREITAGSGINFFDISSYSPTSWQWEFENGTPATSALQNPTNIQFPAGIHKVKLTATNTYGMDTLTKVQYIIVSPVNTSESSDYDFILSQNYPNPCNNYIFIKYNLKQESEILIQVMDITGKEVIKLVTVKHRKGEQLVKLDVSDLKAGIYFYHLVDDKGKVVATGKWVKNE